MIFSIPLLIVLTLILSASALAGPPYQTDDPEPTEHKHYEVFVASEYNRTTDGEVGTKPHIEVNYGLAPDVQIGISIPYAFSNPNHEKSHYGLGDIEVSFKYRFIQETKTTPMISFFPSYKSTTGNENKELGDGASAYFLPIWLGKNWGEWTMNAGAGYTITRAIEAKNTWFFGWQVSKQINEQLSLGAEIFHETEASRGDDSSTGFNFGTIYDISEQHHVLFSAGKGLHNAKKTNQFSSFIAYELTF